MPNLNVPVTWAGGVTSISDASSQNSNPIDAGELATASFMTIFTDAATGSVQLQFSNDQLSNQNVPQNSVPVNWANVPGAQATAAVSAIGGVAVYPPAGFNARWYRLQWIKTTGAGTLSAFVFGTKYK